MPLVAGLWLGEVGLLAFVTPLTITTAFVVPTSTTGRGRLPTLKGARVRMFSGAPIYFHPSSFPGCAPTGTSKIVHLMGKHVVLGGVALPSCGESISIALGMAMTSGNSH